MAENRNRLFAAQCLHQLELSRYHVWFVSSKRSTFRQATNWVRGSVAHLKLADSPSRRALTLAHRFRTCRRDQNCTQRNFRQVIRSEKDRDRSRLLFEHSEELLAYFYR